MRHATWRGSTRIRAPPAATPDRAAAERACEADQPSYRMRRETMTIHDYTTPAPRINQRIDRSPPNRAAQIVGSVVSQSRQTVSVVIPAMNEAENLPYVLPRIPAWVHEVILVDGYSTDGTVAMARELWPSIRIVRQQGRGKGAALRSGF